MNGGIFQIFRPGRFKLNSPTFNIMRLFYGGAQGAWYDPSDITTLYQDAAGTMPVTAMEQPVGRMLDKSGRGNHATQSTTTKRPVYSRRVALNLKSEYPGGVVDIHIRSGLVTTASIPGFLGGTAIAFGYDGVTSSYAYRQDFTPTVGVAYELSVFVKMDDGGAPQFGGGIAAASNVFEFVLSSTAIIPSTNPYVVSPTAVPGIYRVSATGLALSTGLNCGIIKYASNSNRTFRITGFSARLATDAHLPYQWVNTATDYDADPAKFPAYLRFDGVDDAMQTGNIDFTSTDKMTVWAGVTNFGTTTSVLSEISPIYASSPGSYVLTGYESSAFGAFARAASPGTRGVTTPETVGKHRIQTAMFDLGNASGQVQLRNLGLIAPVSATGALVGGGNFGNYPLYTGSRAGASLFFAGRLYSLIVRGAQTPLSQIEATELYIKQKMMMP